MKPQPIYKVLTIAGFDGSGGAGIQADIKTFSALGCYATSALTSIPAQNTTGVKSIHDLPLTCIEDQLRAILDDICIDAVKIGMLHRVEIIDLVANLLKEYECPHIVLDPVMIAKSGDHLLLPAAVEAMIEKLFPLAMVLTPNLLEASEILQRQVAKKDQMEQAAIDLSRMGPQAIFLKGGHLENKADDCLCIKGSSEIFWFPSEKIRTKNTHGTGCTLSAAIASFLAKNCTILEAVQLSKDYLKGAIQAGAELEIGKGNGPVHHFYRQWN